MVWEKNLNDPSTSFCIVKSSKYERDSKVGAERLQDSDSESTQAIYQGAQQDDPRMVQHQDQRREIIRFSHRIVFWARGHLRELLDVPHCLM